MKVELETGSGTLDIITVDDVKISLKLLSLLANPDPRISYKMRRDGNEVIVMESIDDA